MRPTKKMLPDHYHVGADGIDFYENGKPLFHVSSSDFPKLLADIAREVWKASTEENGNAGN